MLLLILLNVCCIMCYAKFKSEDFSITVRKYEGNQYIMELETGGKRVIAKATQ